ncbi:MAG TPA: signal recognition particle-docking protein FtsY [Alphaproteobacteria bacterium]|jgi:fused signal recognition particle receptor|nr:MAG: Signal recognition particle receptor FtsY [Alphaproteobacteria bacterium MarineAlpha7_Bin1]HAE75995.1 signal recognition particle-docking protein FtsY [Alphaproteobacteria bacterium]|tara:strand:- start:407 stop:1345 length:939 start_codon:yes stop_codon:yes gene_type:complete
MVKKTTRSWFSRLRAGLSKSSEKISEGMNKIFSGRRLDESTLSELEDLLISSDLGVHISSQLVGSLERHHFHSEISPAQLQEMMSDIISKTLTPVAKPLIPSDVKKPFVVLVVGVNGSGKTTTIVKFAKTYKDDGLSVTMVAADTFRAAAVKQLEVWGERIECPVISPNRVGIDPAGLIHDAYLKARRSKTDVLLIDTAGRLQNKVNLMNELKKIDSVLKKINPEAPHSSVLVLDATVGQNAHSQVENFKQAVNISGIVMTKLDGTAKGGVLVALADKYALPIHAIGVGEGVDDLRPFAANVFSDSLMGVQR